MLETPPRRVNYRVCIRDSHLSNSICRVEFVPIFFKILFVENIKLGFLDVGNIEWKTEWTVGDERKGSRHDCKSILEEGLKRRWMDRFPWLFNSSPDRLLWRHLLTPAFLTVRRKTCSSNIDAAFETLEISFRSQFL